MIGEILPKILNSIEIMATIQKAQNFFKNFVSKKKKKWKRGKISNIKI